MIPKFTDFWSNSGREYVHSSQTDIRDTWFRLGLLEIDSKGEREVPDVRLGETTAPERSNNNGRRK